MLLGAIQNNKQQLCKMFLLSPTYPYWLKNAEMCPHPSPSGHVSRVPHTTSPLDRNVLPLFRTDVSKQKCLSTFTRNTTVSENFINNSFEEILKESFKKILKPRSFEINLWRNSRRSSWTKFCIILASVFWKNMELFQKKILVFSWKPWRESLEEFLKDYLKKLLK